MANIEPNSVIRLLNNVPLDNKYTDTLYWDNASHQATNMVLQTKYSFTQQTYQRVNKNRLRIQRCADDIYDCNYLMFQNTAFGNKWFYAFITKIEYINNITSEIDYEIDDMQTWLFDYTLRPCFVEREHIADDDMYNDDLRKPEPVDVGDIIKRTVGILQDINYAVLVSYLPFIDPETHLPIWTGSGQVIGGCMYSGCQYAIFNVADSDGLSALENMLATYTLFNADNNIISITTVPANLLTTDGNATTETQTVTRPIDIDGYTPRNKKLLCYPYTFVNIDTGDDSRNYRFEWFALRQNATFQISSYLTDNPQVCVYPLSYNGYNDVYGGVVVNASEKVTMTGFPQLSWRADGFTSKIGAIGRDTIKSGVDIGIRGTNDYRGKSLISNMATGVIDALSFNSGSKYNGINGANTDIARGLKKIYYAISGVTIERAREIDSFFDRYGYACEEIKVPNRNVRENWTYCKTRDCNIIGSIPVDSMSRIKDIYNNGITWWKTIGSVGNYSLSNRTLLEMENE